MQIYKDIFLSGGEKQKLLIDMLPEADVYLLDEPMIGLDEKSLESIFSFLNDLAIKSKAILIALPYSNRGGQDV